MALNIIKRSNTRGPIINKAPEDQNDLLLTVKKSGESEKDVFRVSDKFFEESGLATKELAGLILQDPDTKGIFFAIVPAEFGSFYKAREKFDKTNEFQHKDCVDMLVELNIVPEDRKLNSYYAFDLVEAPAKLAELKEAGIEGGSIYEVVATEVKGRAASYATNVAKAEKTEVKEGSSTEPQAAEAEAEVSAEVEEADEWKV